MKKKIFFSKFHFSFIFPFFLSGCMPALPFHPPPAAYFTKTRFDSLWLQKNKPALAYLQKNNVQWIIVGDEVKIIVYDNTLFENSGGTLKQSASSLLNCIIFLLNQHENTGLIINSYTDARDNSIENLSFSAQHALVVMNYLNHNGLKEPLITAIGKGEFCPLSLTKNEESSGINFNQRTEITTRLVQVSDIE